MGRQAKLLWKQQQRLYCKTESISSCSFMSRPSPPPRALCSHPARCPSHPVSYILPYIFFFHPTPPSPALLCGRRFFSPSHGARRCTKRKLPFHFPSSTGENNLCLDSQPRLSMKARRRKPARILEFVMWGQVL